jgi:uncharacterized membrane protein YoaK (UPF0700 family)
MYRRIDRAHRMAPVILGILTLGIVGALLMVDVFPELVPAKAHNPIGAFALGMIAFAYLVYQSAHRPPWRELLKAVLLAIAFGFWAANQVWPNPRQAVLFNDVAIALFVLDVFLVIIGWPATSPDESFAETLTG